MNCYRRAIGVGFTFAFALCSLVPRDVQATVINYSFSGTGSGTLGANNFNNSPFIVSIDGDTYDVVFQPSLAIHGILNLTGTIDISGLGITAFIEPLFIFGGNGFDVVGFGNFFNGNLIEINELGLGLVGYDLASNFGPIVSPNYSLGAFVGVSTSSGVLAYTTMSDVTFVSTVNAIPEPSSILIAGFGSLCLL